MLRALHTFAAGALAPFMLSVAGVTGIGIARANDTVYVSLHTGLGNDTIVVGLENRLAFSIDTGEDTVRSVDLIFEWVFTADNFIGPLTDTGSTANVVYSDRALSVFEAMHWNGPWGLEATNPDTTWISFFETLAGDVWFGSGGLFYIDLVPTDTGACEIRDAFVAGSPGESAVILAPEKLAVIEWQLPNIVSVDCISASLLLGDVNLDKQLSSADIIYQANYVFKSGGRPGLLALGDTNCSGHSTAADLIVLVNVVFKSATFPCDLCE